MGRGGCLASRQVFHVTYHSQGQQDGVGIRGEQVSLLTFSLRMPTNHVPEIAPTIRLRFKASSRLGNQLGRTSFRVKPGESFLCSTTVESLTVSAPLASDRTHKPWRPVAATP